MSLASDRFYRYWVKQGINIIGAIETTGPVLAGEDINVNGTVFTVLSIDDSNPTQSTTTINTTPTTNPPVISISKYPPSANDLSTSFHGYITHTNEVTRALEGSVSHLRNKVLNV